MFHEWYRRNFYGVQKNKITSGCAGELTGKIAPDGF
jgi:hypothetical protein